MYVDENLITETETPELTDGDIFTKIWTSPQLVFKYLNDTRYDKFVWVLLVLVGIGSAFDRASARHLGDRFPLIAVLGVCIVFGGVFGWISYYIYAALLSWTGKWLKGKADTDSLLRMVSHAMIPLVISLVLLIPRILVFGNEMFRSEASLYETEVWFIVLYYCLSFIETILGLWSLVLIVIGISEVQKFSIEKSILNMILPVVILIVPIAITAFLLGDLFG